MQHSIPSTAGLFILTFYLIPLAMPVFLNISNSCASSLPPDTSVITEKVEQPVNEAIDIRQNTQKGEEDWQKEQEELIAQLDHLAQEQEKLTVQSGRLKKENSLLHTQIEDQKSKLQHIQELETQMKPFLQEIVARLTLFQQKDLPFLAEERTQRLHALKNTMANQDIPLNEKLRKVFETLMIEAEYGQDIETTRTTISLAGKATQVDIFRLGRIGLFFQTLDRSDQGFYNVATQKWQPLEDTEDGILYSIEIATKHQTAKIVSLPLGRIEQP